MDQNLVYAKTPAGDDAVRQSTRVVQRNLRMVLVQVDGKTTVAELGAKIGNSKLVESALRELEEGGFIAPVMQAPSVWEAGKMVAKEIKAAASQFSTFGPKSVPTGNSQNSGLSKASGLSGTSAFSDFGNPLVPPEIPADKSANFPLGERMGAVFARNSDDGDTDIKPGRFSPILLLKKALLVLLVLGCAGLILYPYNNFKPDIEAALGRIFHAQVRIGNVAVGLLPRPALSLQDVRIGAKGEARIEEVRVPSLIAMIGSGQRKIPTVEVSGLNMPADGLGVLLGQGTDGGPAPAVVIGAVRLQRMTITMRDIALSNCEGEMLFKADGKLDKMRLQSADRSLRIEVVPAPQGAMLSIEGLAWKPVDGLPYVFESLQAKGLLQAGRLLLNNIDTTFMGGVLKGNWLLTWSDGMAMAGEASLARMSLRRVLDTFAPMLKMDGDLAGTLRLRGSGKDWKSMWTNAEAALEADVTRGVLSGVDIGEAARRGVGHSVRGGATKFDRLRGGIVVDSQQVTGHDIHLEAGLISTSGRFVVDRERRLDGVFEVNISSSMSGVRVPIRVSGTLPDLVVAAGR